MSGKKNDANYIKTTIELKERINEKQNQQKGFGLFARILLAAEIKDDNSYQRYLLNKKK